MSHRFARLFAFPFAGILLGICAQPGAAQQKTMAPSDFTAWLPVSDAERDQKTPSVEKDAGAEVLLWQVHVVDELLGDNRSFQRVFYNYVRLKIFDDKGKEKAATIDLPYRAPGGILDVSGHTIKADGSVVELDRKTVYKRVIARVGGQKESVVSFAMPAVETGAILEYRWKQTEDDARFRYVRLHFQREFPVQKVTYFIKPLEGQHIIVEEMILAPFNCKTTPMKQEMDGYNSTTVVNVPAARSETYSPTAPNIEPWALLYYRENGTKDQTKYWDGQGKQLYKDFKESVKNDGESKNAASQALAGASDDDGKLTALASYIRKTVRNLYGEDVTSADRETFFQKLPKERERTSTEILRSGLGTPHEMNLAFAALAQQAGFEVRPALVADRGELLFNPKLTDRYFLDNHAVAVKNGGTWKVVDVSDKIVAPTMLPWHEDGMYALLGDSKAPMFVQTPFPPPDASAESRTAKLELSKDGSIAGDVDEAYTGHRAEDYRREISAKSPAQREEWLHDRVTRMFPDSDVTAVKFDGIDDPGKPFLAHYHLQAPRFAQVTGKRILFQPNAFRRGQVSPFSAAQRYYPIEFPYAWKEVDDVDIQLPAGFALDAPDSPGNLNFGKPGAYEIKMFIVKGDRQALHFTRTFTFGNEGMVSFDTSSYPTIKKIFDTVQIRDGHSLALKEN